MYLWLAIALLMPLTALAQDHPTEYYWGAINIEMGEEKNLYLGDDFSYATDMPSFVNAWTSENAEYVKVTSTMDGYCTVKGIKTTSESVKIKCQLSYKVGSAWSSWHGYYLVNVIPAKPNSITILDKLTMKLNEKHQFTYALTPDYAATTVTWKSDRTNVVTIDESGMAEAHTLGTAHITATTANGKSATCEVEVVEGNYCIEGPIKQVAIGGLRNNYYTMILKKDGTLWACGGNDYGQLGDGTTTSQYIPIKVMEHVASVSVGSFHTMILKEDGTLWACGYNLFGQLGDGTTNSPSTPKLIMDHVASVSAGGHHTMIIKRDGTLWSCGLNFSGQLGDGTAIDKCSPVMIMDNVASVSAGSEYTMIVKEDGTLWACGSNYYGQLGDGTTVNKGYPVQVNSNVISVSTGGKHTMIMKSDGSFWRCGCNNVGQLGDGTTTHRYTFIKMMDDVASVSLGNIYSMILKKDGTLWACGDNRFGQLGDGTTTEINSTPQKIMDDVTSVFASKFSAFGCCTMMIKKDGSLWACGNNDYGQLCDGTTISRLLPVKISEAVNEQEPDPNPDDITQGDVNMDGFVNGTDLVALSNIILGRKEQTETADVNVDGSVNGTDIVALSNIILGRGNKAPHRASATASLSVNEDFDIKAGEEKELLINLTNPNNEVTLVQFDLHLPEGLSIKKIGNEFDFDMAGRTTWRKHTLDVNEVDGAYRFLLYSSSNTLIEGTSGAIIKMTIVADGTFKGGMLSIDNSLLVGPDESETKPEAYEYMIGEIPDDGSAKLSLKPFDIEAGETKEMLIELKNPNDEITLVQFDLHLPEGLTIKKSGDELDFDMTGRTTWRKHTLDANEVDGSYRFLLYSSSNTLIEGTSGAIIKVTVTASQEVNGQKIVMDNTLLVSPDEKETKPASYKYVIGTFAKGDVNGDGDIGIGDIITITNVMASNETNADVVRRADVNGDGEVGIGDIISITNIMAGQ